LRASSTAARSPGVIWFGEQLQSQSIQPVEREASTERSSK